MKHERIAPAPRAGRTGPRVSSKSRAAAPPAPATNPADPPADPPVPALTPQQTAARTRKINRAAREHYALQAAVNAEIARREADAREAEAEAQARLDANGFDPADYRWVPVRRQPRKDGWTVERQREFIAALADTGCVDHAAQAVEMSPSSAYRLRRSPGAESFAAAWDLALQHAARVLLDTAFERAFNGSREPVFDREGMVRHYRQRQSDRLIMFLLRAYMPERFRHAHRDWRAPDEPLPPPAAPMEPALHALAPVRPADPHALMQPTELEDAVLAAEASPPGELPPYLRGRGDNPPPEEPLPPAVEAELARLRRGEGYSNHRPKGWKGHHPADDMV